MKKNLVFLSIILYSLMVSADPTSLLGRWAAPCNPANSSGTEYSQDVSEFLPGGYVHSRLYYYDNATCLGQALYSDNETRASYSASMTQLTVKFISEGKNILMNINYLINGSSLLLTPTLISIDGQAQELPEPVILIRK